jgi:hypothetical protein
MRDYPVRNSMLCVSQRRQVEIAWIVGTAVKGVLTQLDGKAIFHVLQIFEGTSACR